MPLRFSSAFPILPLAPRPWALVLSMMRRSHWGAGSYGGGCWLLVRIALFLPSSDQLLLQLRDFPGFLSPPPLSPFSPSFSPPSLLSCSSPYSYSLPSPPPSLFPAPFPPFRPWCSVFPLGTKSLGRRRVSRSKLLTICRRHLLSIEMILHVEWQCLVF